MKKESFHKHLKDRMDTYVHSVYDVTKGFPKDELYGVSSQLRKSSLSVVLNYIEGFSRSSDKANKHFLEISYGSLKESIYLLEFSFKRKYLSQKDYEKINPIGDKIGGMLWGIIKNISKST